MLFHTIPDILSYANEAYGADATTITGSSTASTILLTLKILFTEPTDVPPNFITFISLYIVEMVDTMCRKQAATACIDFN